MSNVIRGGNGSHARFVLLALCSHLAWGIYPVIARYMQTVSMIPPMSFITLGYCILLVLLLWRTRGQISPSLFQRRILWIFALVVTTQAITLALAVGYTKAVYVQLIILMAPFLVVLLSATFLKDNIPRFTWPAITLSFIGVILMMSNGEITGMPWALSISDWAGITLAAISSITLAFYLIIIRRGLQREISAEVMLFVQAISLIISSFILSLVWRDNWGIWRELGWVDWAAFGSYVVIAILFANAGQTLALKHLSAPLVSSFMSVRLVATVIGGMTILGEKFTTPLQVTGTIIVLLTLTVYLWISRIDLQDQAPG